MSYPKRFYDYNTFLRQKFGEKVYKISLDAGFTCPNRDGTKGTQGCIYCNNESFSPAHRSLKEDLEKQILEGMEMGRRFKAKKFLAYFQAFTNTYAEVSFLEKLYSRVLQYPEIAGIVIGTRPDAVDLEKLQMLQEFSKKTFVSLEYGVQSINNDTLRQINRGHTYESFLEAMEWSKGRSIHLCAHIMFGFPGEGKEQILQTAREMNRVGIDGIKIHNLLVVKDTMLAEIYKQSTFPLPGFEEYIDLVCDFLEHLDSRIVCERLHANAPEQYLIAPRWNKSPAQIVDAITAELKRRDSHQGKFFRNQN